VVFVLVNVITAQQFALQLETIRLLVQMQARKCICRITRWHHSVVKSVFTLTRWRSLASITVPWKNSTWVKWRLNNPSNSKSGSFLYNATYTHVLSVKFIKHNQNNYLKLDVSTSVRGLRQKKLVLSSSDSWHDVVIPYVENVSEAVARIMRKHNVPVAMKPYKTLKGVLVHPKTNRIRKK